MYLFTMNVLRFNIEIALEVHIHQRSVFFLEKKIEEEIIINQLIFLLL